MKTSDDPPRFVCRVTRGWISTFASAGAAERSGHVARCEDCQAFFAADNELEGMLRREAVSERAQPSPMLEQKILHAVRRSTAPAPRRSPAPWLSFAGAAAAVALGLVVVRNSGSVSPGDKSFVAPTAKELADYLGGVIPNNLMAEMRPQAEAILNQNPLQNELDAVTANARTAVQFLAKNFLTSDAAQELSARSSG
jgi:hypothetical protein